jgi:hypothetical protein
MDPKELFNAVKELQEKQSKYEYSRNKLVETCKSLQVDLEEVFKSLKSMESKINELNPEVKVTVRNKNAIPTREIVNELIEKIQQGQHVNYKFVSAMYPSIDKMQLNSVLALLANKAKEGKLQKRKENGVVFYYI